MSFISHYYLRDIITYMPQFRFDLILLLSDNVVTLVNQNLQKLPIGKVIITFV